ncbi:chemotaxis response regulator protein-glutamate methylesterase [Aestuariibacter sp. A3R04]|uniref:protein-glutamate methylesterase/protein-glutamine glutaminase n=1 Tax=Aestuariibacter sp. A3R04 TaxID=2841571 RepID=UPI001C095DE5|nr:chemotaxis response regulator protein-glutamate methylesterase [Aestuariibacter sp. A3R04]MBU3021169.1 chemotaxis response regulator protein-glutamate methylesterase [Aestuariibacter sp. A3R04]
MTTKVLVVDDSALIRNLLGEIIKGEEDLTLVGAAPDAFVAKKMVQQFSPDVITLDIEMPKVDGLRFLDVLMKAKPTPVVMISTLTETGADATMRSLELGAIDFIPKPKLGVVQGIEEYRQLILDKIRTAAKSKVRKQRTTVAKSTSALTYSSTEKIIAIGASTGGTEAIKTIVESLPANAPATVITQHMPPGYTSTFAQRLDGVSRLKIVEVKGDERLLPGHGYLAPGDRHMEIVRSGADYRIKLNDGERVSGHRPSVDVMFNSLVTSAGANVVAALLTGMGRDGADGLLALKQQGAYTFCQDEDSCVVFGMPKVAIALGAPAKVLPLDSIAQAMVTQLEKMKAGSRL